MKKNRALMIVIVMLFVLVPGCATGPKHPWINRNVRLWVKHLDTADLKAIAESQRPGDPTANNYESIDSLVYTAAVNLKDHETRIDEEKGRLVTSILESMEARSVATALVRQFFFPKHRQKVIWLSSRLGNKAAQEKFVEMLRHHGDQEMAMDFVNSGSPFLRDHGEEWLRSPKPSKITPRLRMLIVLQTQEDLEAIAEMLKRGDPQVKMPGTIDNLIFSGALCLDKDARWKDSKRGRMIYNMLKQLDGELVGDSMARHVLFRSYRPNLLFLGVKLGIPGSEDKLTFILLGHGDKSMAEDFLNSGSAKLNEGGRRWAKSHDYTIMAGPGSHRARWGQF